MARPPGVRYGTPNVDLILTWATLAPDEDGPFRASDLMKYRPVADDRDRRGEQITGRKADDRHTPREALAGVARSASR